MVHAVYEDPFDAHGLDPRVAVDQVIIVQSYKGGTLSQVGQVLYQDF